MQQPRMCSIKFDASCPVYNITYLHTQGSNGKNHFVFVTNLSPCSGVRLHLWPEKGSSVSTLPTNKRVLEVTSKMVQIPSGPAPRQVLGYVHCLPNALWCYYELVWLKFFLKGGVFSIGWTRYSDWAGTSFCCILAASKGYAWLQISDHLSGISPGTCSQGFRYALDSV